MLALRMQAYHNRTAMGGRLERVSIYELGGCKAKGGYGGIRSDYWIFFASILDLLCVWRIPVGNQAFYGYQFVCIAGRVPGSMPRKRGVPRRGSAWYARKEQRKCRGQLERSLVMATSILRQRARAEEKSLLSTIPEEQLGSNSLDTVKIEESTEHFYPACIVEEDLALADLNAMAMPSDKLTEPRRGDGFHMLKMDDEAPGCIIEEELPEQDMVTSAAIGDAQGDE
jgi:hypothetical protein